MFAISFTMLLGLILITLAVVLIAFSRYREWLLFMFAGMGFWVGLELLRAFIQMMVDIPLLYGYISAFMIFLVGVAVVLAIKDQKAFKKAAAQKINCIEHTPVYEDDQRQYTG